MAFQILRHVILMVVDNLEEALKIVLLPTVLGYGLVMLASQGFLASALEAGETQLPAGRWFLLMGAAVLVQLLLTAWVAVAWHRFILMEEKPAGWFPPLPPTLGAYILSIILLSLLMLPILFALMIPLATLAPVLSFGAPSPMGITLALVPLLALGGTIFTMFAIVLPAQAIGHKLRFSEAWQATKPHFFTIFGVVLLFLVFQLVIGQILSFAAMFGIAELVGGFIVNLVAVLVNVSVLTTIYGITVQGRSLR